MRPIQCIQALRYRKIGIKMFNTLSSQTLPHGSENWAIMARDKFKNTATETKVIRPNVKFVDRLENERRHFKLSRY